MKEVKSKHEFEELIASDSLTIVDFFAEWCGPCKMIKPKLKELAQAYDKVQFLQVNVDDLSEISEEYEIEAMPTFLYFKSGKKIDKVVGANCDKVKETLMKHM